MRTLPPGLAAALKTSTPYVVLIGNLDGGADDGTAQVIEYTLTQHTLSARIENGTSALDSFSQCRLRRGAEIAGVPTYVDTSKLWIRSIVQFETYIQVEASIFPQKYITLAGDDTYENVLTAFAAAIGFTAEFANPSAAFWQYQFLPTGRALTMNDARHLLSMLQQKYLIQAMDAGSQVVRFFCVPNSDAIAAQTPNSPRLVEFGVRPYQSRRFIWRDEANTLHTQGSAADLIHNLGFLPSTAVEPQTYLGQPATSSDPEHLIVEPINLTIETGDRLEYTGMITVLMARTVEEFKRGSNKTRPTWQTKIYSNQWFSTTEAGALPSTIEAAAPYTPLNVSHFDGIMDSSDNNVQAAMDTIDDHGHDASTIDLLNLEDVQSDLQHMQNVIHSAGWLSGGEITDNGDGTVTVAAGTGLIRATDSPYSELYFMEWDTRVDQPLTNNADNWVYVGYNSGNPNVAHVTSEPTDFNTKIILAHIYRTGTELHINETVRHTVGDHAGLMMRAMRELMPFGYVSGAVLSASGTRQFTITPGVWWNGITRFETAAFDGTAQTFNYYYQDGGGDWSEVAAQTAINNTQYDNGSGTLATLTANRYGVHWLYLATDDDVHVIFGQGDYTLQNAIDATPPSIIPEELQTDSRILGKIIIQKSAGAFTQIESALESFSHAITLTAADILTALLTVDGAGSGLDADLLDGSSSAAFATSGHTHAAGDATTLDGIDSTAFAQLAAANVFTANQGISKTDPELLFTPPANGQVIKHVLTKAAINDNSATQIFQIVTTNESGNADGGVYVCDIVALVAHAGLAPGGNTAVKKWRGSFSRAMAGAGTGANTAIEDVFSGTSVATTAGSRDLTTITGTVAETSEYDVRFSLQIDLTGSGVTTANVILEITLLWSGFTTPPVITGL
jgi:hypothetical protein